MQTKNALRHTIGQMLQLLGQLEPQEYRQPLEEFGGSTLGQHFRHILEFFVCLERGLENGVVDYASRERNLLFEDAPGVAAVALEKFESDLAAMQPSETVLMRAEFGDLERPAYASTVGRELAFVYDHAIHHLAMIKVGLRCQFPHVNTDKNLGVSPSTIKAQQVQVQAKG